MYTGGYLRPTINVSFIYIMLGRTIKGRAQYFIYQASIVFCYNTQHLYRLLL
jgi:hypothetical protein